MLCLFALPSVLHFYAIANTVSSPGAVREAGFVILQEDFERKKLSPIKVSGLSCVRCCGVSQRSLTQLPSTVPPLCLLPSPSPHLIITQTLVGLEFIR